MKKIKQFLTSVTFLLLTSLLHATVGITTSITHNTCYNGTNGAISALGNGASSGQYEYRLAATSEAGWVTNGTFSSLAAGTYPISVRDKLDIDNVSTVFITINQPGLISVSPTVTNTSCASSTDGMISLAVSGGVSPYTYAWTKNGTTISGATASSLSMLAPGVYNAIVTDANGCQQQLTDASSTAIIPLTLSGYNHDLIANGTNTSSVVNSTVSSEIDRVITSGATPFKGTNFYVNGFTSNSVGGVTYNTNGLPANGSITSESDPTHKFLMAAYSSQNGLRLNNSGANGTLTLATGSRGIYQALHILATSCNGTSTVDYIVTYADNSTTTGSMSVTDWAGGTANKAISTLGRVFNTETPGVKDGEAANPNSFALYDLPISIPANTKTVVSVKFTNASTLGRQANIFAITGSTSSIGVTVAPGPAASITPAVGISANPSNLTYCSGASYTFTANPSNAGLSPTYTWTVNGVTQVSTSATMNTILTGTGVKTVSVTMQVTDPAATCLTTQTATTSVILNSGAVSTAISVSGPTAVCQGNSTTYIATPTNGGAAPTYVWYVNGAVVPGATGATYTAANGSAGNNTVYATMTSSVLCATPATVAGNSISTTVSPNLIPSVSISGTGSSPVTFAVTTSANLGSSPTYQWYLNGNPISGATSSTYVANSPVSSDSYSLAVKSSITCANPVQVMSNYVKVNTVLPVNLAAFSASLNSTQNAAIFWLTTTETNVKHFEIERATGAAVNFQTVALVAANNNLSGSAYNYIDHLNTPGTYYYRLKSVDFDGRYTLSSIEGIVSGGSKSLIVISPNPVVNTTTISGINPGNTIRLFNAAGKVLKVEIATGNTLKLRLTDYPAGLYLIQVTANGKLSETIKLTKQ